MIYTLRFLRFIIGSVVACLVVFVYIVDMHTWPHLKSIAEGGYLTRAKGQQRYQVGEEGEKTISYATGRRKILRGQYPHHFRRGCIAQGVGTKDKGDEI